MFYIRSKQPNHVYSYLPPTQQYIEYYSSCIENNVRFLFRQIITSDNLSGSIHLKTSNET